MEDGLLACDHVYLYRNLKLPARLSLIRRIRHMLEGEPLIARYFPEAFSGKLPPAPGPIDAPPLQSGRRCEPAAGAERVA